MTQQNEQAAVAEKPTVAPATRLTVSPRYRVEETTDAFVVTAHVPGAGATDVETVLDGEKLVVNARRSWTKPEAWTTVHREISQADYRLVLGLDRRVSRDGVRAQLTQGVLTLTLPKAEELKPRKIEIAG